VMEGAVFTLYAGRGANRTPMSTPLKGAMVKAPILELKGKKLDQPAVIKELIAQRKYPFTINWPASEVDYDIVCAAATSADRSAWIKALNAQFKRMRAGAPTSGWLMKQGGRQMGKGLSKLAAMSWKRRWFVLTQPSEGRPATFAYYDGPNVTNDPPRGLVLLNASAQIFMTDKTKKPHCFCIQSTGAKDGKAITTILSATSNEEVKKWMRSLQGAIKASGGVVDQSAKLSKLAALGGTMTSQKMGATKTAMFENLKRLEEPELLNLPMKKLEELAKYLDMSVPKEALTEKLRDGKPDKRPLVKLITNKIQLEKMTTGFGAGAGWGMGE